MGVIQTVIPSLLLRVAKHDRLLIYKCIVKINKEIFTNRSKYLVISGPAFILSC